MLVSVSFNDSFCALLLVFFPRIWLLTSLNKLVSIFLILTTSEVNKKVESVETEWFLNGKYFQTLVNHNILMMWAFHLYMPFYLFFERNCLSLNCLKILKFKLLVVTLNFLIHSGVLSVTGKEYSGSVRGFCIFG